MNSFFETLKQLGLARLAIMGGILIGLLLFFVFVSMRVATPQMKLLYSDLTTEDSGAMAAKLEESQIKYAVSADGARIMVPETDVGKARILLAQAGLPNGGSLGYEIFDKQSSFGTTNFVQNINQVRALEGELSRTIGSMESVRSARVHLVLPERELFSKAARQSSASVYIGVRPGKTMENESVYAIRSLVASAVPNLKASNVTVVDSNGELLARGGEDEEGNMMSAKAEEMRRSYETRLTDKIEDQVSRIVGFGKVRAIVTAEMNFDRINTNEELFDPNGQVVRSTQTSTENSLERDNAANDSSVQNNLPAAGPSLLADSKPSNENNTTEETTNFEINKTIRNTIREAGEIKHLSISVLVDGRYEKPPAPEGEKADKKEGDAAVEEPVYKERSPEELKQIEELVKSAAGYDEKRGDTVTVKNLPFAEVDTDEEFVDDSMIFGFPKADLIDSIEVLVIGVMVFLVILLVVRPMVTRLLSSIGNEIAESVAEANMIAMRAPSPALAAPSAERFAAQEDTEEESLINVAGVEGKVKTSTIKRVEEIVENYPTETVSVIRSWMTQEN